MMDKAHLHLLINEEIYLIDPMEKQYIPSKDEPTKHKADPSQASSEKREIKYPKETPVVSNKKTEEQVLPLVIFHESSVEPELQLLQKIIEACKLKEGSYTVFGNGFNEASKFKKAIAFVAEPKTFYEPIKYQGSQILYAKPLSQIANDQREKAKLWSALQKFI